MHATVRFRLNEKINLDCVASLAFAIWWLKDLPVPHLGVMWSVEKAWAWYEIWPGHEPALRPWSSFFCVGSDILIYTGKRWNIHGFPDFSFVYLTDEGSLGCGLWAWTSASCPALPPWSAYHTRLPQKICFGKRSASTPKFLKTTFIFSSLYPGLLVFGVPVGIMVVCSMYSLWSFILVTELFSSSVRHPWGPQVKTKLGNLMKRLGRRGWRWTEKGPGRDMGIEDHVLYT